MMHDMTMCPGGNCPLRFGCLRFVAEPAGKQDFFTNIPYTSDKGCREFIDAMKMIRKTITNTEIQKEAYLIFKQNREFNQYVWTLAEERIKLEYLVQGRFSFPSPDQKDKIPKAQIDLTLNDLPSMKVQVQAYLISVDMKPSIQMLHWVIAETTILYRKLKEYIRKAIIRNFFI